MNIYQLLVVNENGEVVASWDNLVTGQTMESLEEEGYEEAQSGGLGTKADDFDYFPGSGEVNDIVEAAENES